MTRGIELYNKTWECPECGRNAILGVKKCRKCGTMQPTYGFIEDKPTRANLDSSSEKKNEVASDDETFFRSTLKMKPGHEPAKIKDKK